jgi:hypothetical protein
MLKDEDNWFWKYIKPQRILWQFNNNSINNPVLAGFMVNKVTLEQFFSVYFGSPLSASFHYCCILFHSPVITLYYVNSRQRHGPGSVVGIATGYWLDGPGIESR